VGQDDPLGIAGRARRVEDHRGIGGRHRDVVRAAAGSGRTRLAVEVEPRTVRGGAAATDREGRAGSLEPPAGQLGRVQQARRGEQERGCTIGEQSSDLFGGIAGVQRNGDGAEPQDAEIGRAPVGVVVGEQRATATRPHTVPGEKARGRPGHGAEPLVAEALESVATLQLDCGPPGEPFGRVAEAVVEAPHGPILSARSGRRAGAVRGGRHDTSSGLPPRGVLGAGYSQSPRRGNRGFAALTVP